MATFNGTTGNDSLTGTTSGDSFFGGAGNDTMVAAEGNDTVYGGTGNDVAYGGTGLDTITGEAGNDFVDGGDGNDNLTGGQGFDTIYGGNQDDVIIGDGQWYSTTPSSGSTATNLTVTNSADGPIDLWWVDGSGALVYYATIQPGQTYVQGTFVGHRWFLRDPDGYYLESITAGTNTTVTYGPDLADQLYGGDGNDTILAQYGNDTVFGGLGQDSIEGGYGNDSLSGGADNDTIRGGAGTDTLVGGAGADSLDGGPGLDIADYSASGAAVNVNLQTGTASGGDAAGDTFWGIDGIFGSAFNDTLIGQDAESTVAGDTYTTYIDGGAGNDNIDGRAGNDTLFGGSGSDTVLGGDGADLIYGGADTVVGQRLTNGDFSSGNTGWSETGGGVFSGSVYLFDANITSGTLTHNAPISGLKTGPGTNGAAQIVFDIAWSDSTPATDTGVTTVEVRINGVTYATITTPNGDGTQATVTYSNGASGPVTTVFETSAYVGPVSTLTINLPTSVPDSGTLTFFTNAVGADDVAIGNFRVLATDTVAAGNDSLDGGIGNDTIYFGTGNNSVYGGDGDDVIDDVAGTYLASSSLIYAGSGNDTVWFGEGNSTVYGGAGNDFFDDQSGTQLDGANLLYGGDGADSVLSGLGNDSVYGDAGNDTLYGQDGNDLIDGGADADSLYGGTGNDTLIGGAGNDQLFGEDDADTFTVNDNFGNDTIFGGSGGTDTDTIDLSALTSAVTVVFSDNENGTITSGANTITFTDIERLVLTGQADSVDGRLADAIWVDAGAGNDTILGGDATSSVGDTIFGGAGNDSIAGLWGADSLDGGLGDDTIDGGDQGDTILGGDGNDVIDAGEENAIGDDDLVYGGFGNDTITSTETDAGSNDTLYGGDGNDVISTMGGAAFLYGDAGTDTLTGGNANDQLFGGDGNDSLASGSGNDTLDGGTGNDSLSGGDGNDTLSGGDGSDTLIGGTGADSLSGGADADVIYGAAGDTVVGGETTTAGGTDSDTLILNYADVQSITYGGGTNEAGTVTFTAASGGGTLTFSEIENIRYTGAVEGTAGNDSMGVGFVDAEGDRIDGVDGDNDTVLGGGGNDTIDAGSGTDLVFGGDGNDRLDGGINTDTIYGGAGDDTILASTGANEVNVGDSGIDTYDIGNSSVSGVAFNVVLDGTGTLGVSWSGIENVNGGSANDTIVGNAENNVLAGNDDADSISGGNGNDSIYGGIGNDTLNGDGGNDLVDGGAGNDYLAGGAGTDSLSGGDGADTLFSIGGGADTLLGGADGDTFDLRDLSGQIITGGETTTTGTDTDRLTLQFTSAPVTVTFTGNEAGTINDGTNSATFTEIEQLATGSGNDTINGGTITTATSVNAGAGTDWINLSGTSGNNTIEAADGNDFVYGGSGDEVIYGGSGNDQISGNAGNDTVNAGGDDDFVMGGDGDDSIDGAEGDDFIQGNAGADTIFGGDGNDYLLGAAGDDLVVGGGGQDTFQVNTSDGNDTIQGGETGVDNDTLVLEIGSIVTYGGGNNESGTVALGSGATVLFSEIENVQFTGLVDGTSGNDSIGSNYVDAQGDELDGSDGDNDTVLAGFGDDEVKGLFGDDSLDGGDGTDIAIYTGAVTEYSFDYDPSGALIVTDSVGGRDGTDTISGFEYVEFGGVTYHLVTGDDGSNTTLQGPDDGTPSLIIAHDGNDWGGGHPTSDVIFGGAGDDTLDGGDGDDTLLGEDGNDLLRGDAGNDQAFGGAGNDTLSGGAGADSLSGGDEADAFIVEDGFGNDTIIGGEGGTDSDALDLSALTNGATVVLTGDESGTVTNFTADTITFSEIEAIEGTGSNDYVNTAAAATNSPVVYGGAGDDIVEGGVANDSYFGGDGADILSGQGGDDSLTGDAGADLIAGGDGADEIFGGADGDTLFGGAGNDQLTGGTGSDTFGLTRYGEADIVTDFDMTLTGLRTADQLDVTDLRTLSGDPITWRDVVVTDTVGDGSGDAVLTFPSGESVVLQSVSPSQVDGKQEMASVGIPCFVSGTRIQTPTGWARVEELRAGDVVSTEQGPLKVLWTGDRQLQRQELDRDPDYLPIHFPAGAIGNDRPLRLSGQHAVLVIGADGTKGLARAKHLAEIGFGGARVAKGILSVRYHHILVEKHAVLNAEGAPTESFYPGPSALAMLDWPTRFSLAGAVFGTSGLIVLSDPAAIAMKYGARVYPMIHKRAVATCSPACFARPEVA